MISAIPKQRLFCKSMLHLNLIKNFNRLNKFAGVGYSLTKNRNKYTKPNFVAEEWITIYQFPYIAAIAKVSKLKNFQYALSCISAPIVFGFEYYAMIPQGCFDLSLVIGGTGSFTFTLVGLIFRNLVGFVYVNPENQLVRFGYLTFWSRREDTVFAIESIKPFSEVPKFKFNPADGIEMYDSEKKYKIFSKLGVIRRDLFELVFGHC